MIFYEMLVLLKPEISQEMYDQVKSNIENTIIEEGKGVLKSVDRWGKYLLAYPIQKSSYGVYVLFRFGISNDIKKRNLFEQLRSFCIVRFNNVVMRHIFVKQGKTINDDYCRPDSLTDAPRRERGDGGSSNKEMTSLDENIHFESSL